MRAVVLVHVVRELHLLDIALGEETDLEQHAREAAASVCSAREAEHADSVAESEGVLE